MANTYNVWCYNPFSSLGKNLLGAHINAASHPNFLLHQLSGKVNLLRRTPNSEHFDVGVSIGRRVPLQLNPGPWLLADAFDRLTTWKIQKQIVTDTATYICLQDIQQISYWI